jgi:UDP-N-acetylenolpyruvoylglucosamine reductase
MIEKLKFFLDSYSIKYDENVMLSKKSWIRTGGICACWVMPQNTNQLELVVRYLYKNNILFDIVGQTSNIFFHSSYNPEVVISTMKVNSFLVKGDIVSCDCGANVVKLAKEMLNLGYAGFYGLIGLPGTVGSAIVNNSGCFNCSLSSMLVSATCLMEDNTIRVFKKEDMKYSHRSSIFKRKECRGTIMTVDLKLIDAKSIDEEKNKSYETIIYRKKNQEGPLLNLGSTFSILEPKKNWKNRLAPVLSKVIRKLDRNTGNSYKDALLLLYHYWELRHYISDKNINTFLWKGKKAEEMFGRYKDFMSRIYNNPKLEIEERI